MKRRLSRLLVGAALLMAGALGPGAAQDAKPAQNSTLTSLSLIVFPGGETWPIWVAKAQGFFAKNGIDVHVTPTPGSIYQMTNLINGKFDLALTAIDNVIAYDEGQGEAPVSGAPDLVAVQGGDNGLLRLVTVPSVPTYETVKGKELTVDALTTGYAFVLQDMLRRGGLKSDDYKLVKAGGALERFNDLMAEKHAGTLLISPFEVIAESKGFHLLGSAADTLGHYQGLVTATRRSWAREHGPEIISFIRAYQSALDWLFEPANKAAAIALLRENAPAFTESLAEKTYGILLDPKNGFARHAEIDEAGMQTVLRLRSEYARPQKALMDPNKYLDLSYYEQAHQK